MSFSPSFYKKFNLLIYCMCLFCSQVSVLSPLSVFILILWRSSCEYSTCLAALGKNSKVHTRGPVLSHVFLPACGGVRGGGGGEHSERKRDTHRELCRYALASRGSNKLPTSTFIIFHFRRAGDVLLFGETPKIHKFSR